LISGSPAGVSGELLRALQEHVIFTVAVDSGANWAHMAGIEVDLVLGDLDSIDNAVCACFRQQNAAFLTVDAHKDETDLELALSELTRRGFTAVLATNVLGGRLDHELASLGALARMPRLHPLVIEDTSALIFLSAQEAGRSQVRLAGICKLGGLVSILPINGEATVTTTGMQWDLHGETLRAFDPRGVSNIVRVEGAAIEVQSGDVLVVLPA
jgi:thiamine pyrophosphokinase